MEMCGKTGSDLEKREFICLAAVLDACSRRVIGWALDRTLEAVLWLEAFEMALGRRPPIPAGMAHHSAPVDSVCEVRRSTTERAFTQGGKMRLTQSHNMVSLNQNFLPTRLGASPRVGYSFLESC